jgi:hypothetical protein
MRSRSFHAHRWTRAVALGVLLASSSAPALAALDPARAQADADAVLLENDAFCKNPSRPLSPRARSLCDLAPEVPRCEGFAKACAEAPEHEKLSPEERRRLEREKEKKPESGDWRNALAAFARVAVWVLIALVVVAILFPIVQAILRRRRDKQLADAVPEPVVGTGPAPPPPEPVLIVDDPERLLARANDLAQRGELDAALYTYLRASLSALDARGAVRVARHRTNGEYVRSCKEPASKAALREIVLEVDRAQFGAKPVTIDRVTSVGQRAFAVVRAVPAALVLALVLLVGGVTGCGGGGERAKGARDPAGTEVMAGILKKQGIELSGLGGSLLSLPLPDPAADPETETEIPAVIVNGSSTELDAEVEAHLLAWVEAGGFLILTGNASSWPHRLGATSDYSVTSKEVVVSTQLHQLRYDADDEDEDENGEWERHGAKAKAENAKKFERIDKGFITRPAAFKWTDPPEQATTIARTGDDHIFASLLPMKKGAILVLASDELFANASLARKDNPGALIAILSHVDR